MLITPKFRNLLSSLRTAGLLLCAGSLSGPACADIYMFVASDGAVSYSDRREHPGYVLLVKESVPAATAAEGPGDVPSPVSLRAADRHYAPLIATVAKAHGVEPELLQALVKVESGFNPRARSPKGAVGLGQLMPETAARFGVRDRFDPAQNLGGAAQYLRYLLTLFNGDTGLALAAYNAGENAVIRHGRRIPPYAETRRYVPAVLADYAQRRRSQSPSPT
jgi:soluble lytic murein transglycosylase-like protein